MPAGASEQPVAGVDIPLEEKAETPSPSETPPEPAETTAASLQEQTPVSETPPEPAEIPPPVVSPERAADIAQTAVLEREQAAVPPVEETETQPEALPNPPETDISSSPDASFSASPERGETARPVDLSVAPADTAQTTVPGPEPATGSPAASRVANLPQERLLQAYSLTPGFSLNPADSLLILSGTLLETTRLVVSADGKERFSGILEAGSEHRWEAQHRFFIQIDNAQAVTLSLQGHPLKLVETPNRKLRLFISRASIWVEEIAPVLPNAGSDF